MKQYLKEKISDNQLDLKTAIVLNKAIRTFKPYEAKAAKEHGLTPTQFSVLETLYSKGELRIQDLIEKILPDHIDSIVEALSILEDSEKEDLIRILKKFKDLWAKLLLISIICCNMDGNKRVRSLNFKLKETYHV